MMNSKRHRLLKHCVYILLAAVLLYPLLWMVGSSFKPNEMIFNDSFFWPRVWTFDNYAKGLAGVSGNPFYKYVINSIVLCSLSMLGATISCSLAGYAFGRLEFNFRKTAFAVMMITLMLPMHVKLIPQYILFNKLGWINSFLPIALPKWFAVDGFFIFLIVQFIRGIPRELDNAATVDGCGPYRIFWYVIVPLSKPAIITAGLYSFLWTWDDFFSQLVYLGGIHRYTVPMGLRLFLDASSQSNYGAMFAMATLSLLPCFAIFMFCQKYLVEGIATTGMKL